MTSEEKIKKQLSRIIDLMQGTFKTITAVEDEGGDTELLNETLKSLQEAHKSLSTYANKVYKLNVY